MENSAGDFDSENEPLRRDVRLLGDLLGATISRRHGASLVELVEEVRTIAKEARAGERAAARRLIDKLSGLPAAELLNLARAFTLFLNLANIAEQHHQIRQRRLSALVGDDANLNSTEKQNANLSKKRKQHCRKNKSKLKRTRKNESKFIKRNRCN